MCELQYGGEVWLFINFSWWSLSQQNLQTHKTVKIGRRGCMGEQLHKVPHGIKCLVDKVWYLIHCVLKVWHFEHTIDQICCYWYSSSWNVEEWNIKLSMLITFVSPVISLCRKYFCLGKVNILSLAMILLAVVTLSLCYQLSCFFALCLVCFYFIWMSCCVFPFHRINSASSPNCEITLFSPDCWNNLSSPDC